MENTWAWSSQERSLEFAYELSKVRISDEQNEIDNRVPATDSRERLQKLLNLLEDFAPVKFATIWKHKARGQVISAVARSNSYRPDPSKSEDRTEYVCEIRDTHAEIIVNESRPIKNCTVTFLREWHCTDVRNLPDDLRWNNKDRIEDLELTGQHALTLEGFCNHIAISSEDDCRSKQATDFILNIYLDDEKISSGGMQPENFSLSHVDHRLFIKSIANKIASGICALVEQRKNKITRLMTELDITESDAQIQRAMSKAVRSVLPDFIQCRRQILLGVDSSGSLELVMDDKLRGTEAKKLEMHHLGILERAFEKKFQSDSGDPRRNDVALFTESELKKIYDRSPHLPPFRQMLVARIHARSNVDRPVGYLVLADRINDLAYADDMGGVRVNDSFDWEDEIYIQHIASILDFIAGLHAVRDQSLRQAMVLGHEVSAPMRYVKETAERLEEEALGQRFLYDRMKLREINDIIDTADYLGMLGESLSALFSDEVISPANRYDPVPTDFALCAREMARMSLPVCKKYSLNNKNITVHQNLPELYFDEVAARQIFLNLIVNAAKYHSSPEKFKVTVSCEYLQASQLQSTRIWTDTDYAVLTQGLGISAGYLISVEDNGIGIDGENPQSIFNAGIRQTRHMKPGIFGAGLGLTIVRQIVHDHFGEIWVEQSSDPTIICIFLPDILEGSGYMSIPKWHEER